jgi:carboxyl-terminal processing protease
MPRSQTLLFAVLAAVAVALVSFAGGLLAGGLNDGETDRLARPGRIAEGEGSEVIADALEQIRSTAVEPPTEQALVRGALRGIVKVLKKSDDPYALFYSPQGYRNFQELTTGKFSGIGVWVRPRSGRLEVVSVLPQTPARRAGLERGDVITRIDELPVSGMSPDEAVARIKGREGTSVDLTVDRGGDTLSYTITRASIDLPNLKAGFTPERFGYVRLFGFARHAGDQLRAQVRRFVQAGAKGMILDLRDNGGGLFSEGVDVASVFIENGEVVVYREKDSEDVVYEAEGDAFQDVPLVVLVNSGTASASEIVAGALQDRGRAIIVGTRTYGKGSVQEIVPLLDSSALKLTTATYLTPSGHDINGSGIEPDVVVDASASIQRSRAIEILNGIVLSTTGAQG